MTDPNALTANQLQHVDRLFDELLDCDDRTRRRRLDALEGEAPELRIHLERLLAATDDRGGRFERGTAMRADLLAEDPTRDVEPTLPRSLGRYRLLEQIGRGGMGVVYRAERADGAFDQEVAVKLLHPGTHPDLERRFDRERRILATLVHPHIARLLDGGVTPTGEPYLVVEMVHGQRLDHYCRQQEPPLQQKVRMLVDICSAVELAHRNLIVHRDIKPANILVEETAQAKLLDFGIAKLLEGSGDSDPDLTRTRHKVMTVQYASPEQFRGEPVNVQSDIYQLGLLAYEILSGNRPYDLEDALPTQAQLWITERDPPPPSRVMVDGRLPTDLDLIVMKAMRKEPDRRYPSVAALREDLERYLDGRPIQARPNSWLYRTRRFLQRHAVPVAVGVVASVLLLASSLAFTRGLIEARSRAEASAEAAQREARVATRAATETDAVLDFVVGLLRGAGADSRNYRDQTVLDLLESGREQIEGALQDQPRARAQILATLSELYRRSDLAVSTELIDQAIAVARTQLDSGELGRVEVGLDLAGYLATAGRNAEFVGDYQRALELYEEASRLVADHRGPDSREAGVMLENTSAPLLRLGRIDEGLEAAREAVNVLSAATGAESQDSVRARRALADALAGNGRLVEARGHAARVLDVARSSAVHQPLLALSLASLAHIESQLGNDVAAESLFDEAAQRLLESNGPGTPNRIILLGNQAASLVDLGRVGEALDVVRVAFAETDPADTAVRVPRANLLLSRAAAYQAQDRHREALADLTRAEEILIGTFPESHPILLDLGSSRADSLAALGRGSEAESLYLRTIARAEASLGEEAVFLFSPLVGLAKLHLSRGDRGGARPLLERALQLRAAQLSNPTQRSEEARRLLEDLTQDR